MATLASSPSALLFADPTVRPVWRAYGGGGLAIGGAVLLLATILEWSYFAGGAVDSALLLAYGISFVAALALLAAATVPLALGATGRDGIVGRSGLGRVALIVYGWAFLAAQVLLLFSLYGASPEAGAGALRSASLAMTVLQTLAAVIAVVAILRAHVATGLARWSFAVSVIIGILAGAIANAGLSLDLMMLGFCLSAVSIAFTGITYWLWRAPGVRRSTVDASAEVGDRAQARAAAGW